MTHFIASEYRTAVRPTVIALHCSGGSGGQWKLLRETMHEDFTVIAPDLIGCGTTGHWNGERAFSLSIEAAPIVRMIDEADGPVHLVGHSYGASVALRAACERVDRIATLSFYEPVSFHLLAAAGPAGRSAFAEVASVFADILNAVTVGALRHAAERFADYWGGIGTFAAAPEKVRDALTSYMPKAPFEYHALVSERVPLASYERLAMPVLLMRGEHTLPPTRLIAQLIGQATRSPVQCIAGAGHMGPLSHADTVTGAIAQHIRRASFRAHDSRDISNLAQA